MCLMIFATTLGSARSLSGWLALLAGCCFAVLAATIKLWKKWNITKELYRLPLPLFTVWRSVRALSELRSVNKIVHLFVLAGMFWIGMIYQQARQRDQSDGYRMHIKKVLSPRRYLSELVSKQGAVLSDPFVFKQCKWEPDFKLDAGETDDVTFLESSDDEGECKSLSGTNYGFRTMRDSQGNIIHTGVEQ